MRQVKMILILVLMLTMSLTGCGQKDVEDIIKEIEQTYNSMESYKAIGTMKVYSEEGPQVYSVEVWYSAPHYYKIALNNVNTKVTQIVLRNDDGVFVLDPALNKSYRFQSDWPENNDAVYLYQSIAKSVLNDSERTFTNQEDNYQFEVKANYQNKTLSQQKVLFDKDMRPMKVEVFDPNQKQLIEMVYTEFIFDIEFEDDAFDMERNLTGWDLNSLMGTNEENEDYFGFIEPTYVPEGVVRNTPKFVEQENGNAIVIKYTGELNYTLIETKPTEAINVSAPDMSTNEIVDLGFGIGVLTELMDTKNLTWTYDGVEFKLTGDLPREEMVNIAKSVFGQTGK